MCECVRGGAGLWAEGESDGRRDGMEGTGKGGRDCSVGLETEVRTGCEGTIAPKGQRRKERRIQ